MSKLQATSGSESDNEVALSMLKFNDKLIAQTKRQNESGHTYEQVHRTRKLKTNERTEIGRSVLKQNIRIDCLKVRSSCRAILNSQ